MSDLKLFSAKVRLIKYIIILWILAAFLLFLAFNANAQQLNTFLGLRLNSVGGFMTAQEMEAKNKFIQPVFGLIYNTSYADVSASVSAAYGSYMGLRIESKIDFFPLFLLKLDNDLEKIDKNKLIICSFGVELDDTRRPLFGMFFGIGPNISFPILDNNFGLSFQLIIPKTPSKAFLQIGAKYQFGGNNRRNKIYF